LKVLGISRVCREALESLEVSRVLGAGEDFTKLLAQEFTTGVVCKEN